MSIPRIKRMIIKINPSDQKSKFSMALKKWHKQRDAKYQINRQLNLTMSSINKQENRNSSLIQYDECISSSFSYLHILLAISVNRPGNIALFVIIPLSLSIMMIKKKIRGLKLNHI